MSAALTLPATTATRSRPVVAAGASDVALAADAAASVWDLLRSVPPEWRDSVRQDLSQELLVKLLVTRKIQRSGLKAAARTWMLNYLRDEQARRDLEREYDSGHGRRYRTGENWTPRWYPPHRDACAGAWFACEGAGVMTVHGDAASSRNDVEDALIAWIDGR